LFRIRAKDGRKSRPAWKEGGKKKTFLASSIATQKIRGASRIFSVTKAREKETKR